MSEAPCDSSHGQFAGLHLEATELGQFVCRSRRECPGLDVLPYVWRKPEQSQCAAHFGLRYTNGLGQLFCCPTV